MKASRDDRHQAVVLEKYQNKRETTSCLVNLKKGWITKKRRLIVFLAMMCGGQQSGDLYYL